MKMMKAVIITEDYSKQQEVLKAPNKAQVWMVVLQNMKVKDLTSSQNF